MATKRGNAAAVLSALVLGSCGGTTVTTTTTAVHPYDEEYVYGATYPTDVIYSSYYWADDWNYSTVYYAFLGSLPSPAQPALGGRDGGSAADGGSTVPRAIDGIAGAIESLARGMSVCPGRVTVTPKTSPPACADSTKSQERSGVTIGFNGCTVGASQIDGTVDVTTMRQASISTCSSATAIMSQTTLTITNLSVRQVDGAGIVMPSQTAAIMATYLYGQNPQTVTATSSGQLQVFDGSGKMLADLATQENDSFSLPDAKSYSIDGTAVLGERSGNSTATITKAGVARSGGCCWPTSGTIVVDRTGGASPGKVSWQFGPSCGDVTRNGTAVTLPACLQ